MLKMEIALDRRLLEEEGYDWDTSYEILCKNFERLGFVKEFFENGHLVYRGTGSDKDFSYFGLIIINLVEVTWFKKCVKYWHFFDEIDNKVKRFNDDCIEVAVRRGYEGFHVNKSIQDNSF